MSVFVSTIDILPPAHRYRSLSILFSVVAAGCRPYLPVDRDFYVARRRRGYAR
jgi:hypothetical protein